MSKDRDEEIRGAQAEHQLVKDGKPAVHVDPNKKPVITAPTPD